MFLLILYKSLPLLCSGRRSVFDRLICEAATRAHYPWCCKYVMWLNFFIFSRSRPRSSHCAAHWRRSSQLSGAASGKLTKKNKYYYIILRNSASFRVWLHVSLGETHFPSTWKSARGTIRQALVCFFHFRLYIDVVLNRLNFRLLNLRKKPPQVQARALRAKSEFSLQNHNGFLEMILVVIEVEI